MISTSSNIPASGGFFRQHLFTRLSAPAKALTLTAALLLAAAAFWLWSADSATATTLTPVAQTECVSAPEGLLAWYRGENDANETVSGQRGEVLAGATYATGKTGQAFSLNGRSGVIAAPPISVNQAAFTIEAWVYPTQLDGQYEIIVSQAGATSVALSGAGGALPAGNLAFALGDSEWLDGGASVPLHTWSHVALSSDGGAVRIYLNGVLTRTITGLSGKLAETAGPLAIGARAQTNSNEAANDAFNGLIDEVALYGRALTPQEIQTVFAAGKCALQQPGCTAPVYTNNFESAVGSEWSVNRTEATPVGARRFLGQFVNETASLTLNNLPPHVQINVAFDAYIIRSWDGNSTMFGPDIFDVRAEGGPVLTRTTFALQPFQQAWPGEFPGGNNPAYTGAAERNSLGYTFEGAVKDAVFRVTKSIPHTTASLRLNFSASGLESLPNESWGIDNINITLTCPLPTVTPGTAVSAQQGSPGAVSTIATVSDPLTPAGSLTVTATTVPTGLTVTGITNTNGTITANIAAGCNATPGPNTVVLTVTNSNGGSTTANLVVNVPANTPPTLGAYPAGTINIGAGTSVTPSAAPRDNGSVAALTATAPGFTGTLTGNASTGVITIANPGPAGNYTVTVTATDNCGATATSTFALTINRLSSAIVLTASPGPYIQGQPVILTAMVMPGTGNMGTPTGTVTFFDGTTALGAVPLDATGKAILTTTALGAGGRSITAVYNGDGTFLTATSTPLGVSVAFAVANVSAASYGGGTLSPEEIVSAFGTRLATASASAPGLPLPTTLAGTTVRVRDSAGGERLAPLFFVSPGQVNYLLPPGTAPGAATITITAGDGAVSLQTIQIAPISPSLFSADSTGRGVAAALILRVQANGNFGYEPVARFEGGRWVPVPIDLGAATDEVFLVLFGTGIRGRTALTATTVRIAGVDAPVSYAGPQGAQNGLDQVNASLPRTLLGRGDVDVVLTVDGRPANTVRVTIR